MRILFVHPAVNMSISDVSRGYRSALERQGHDIRDYSLAARFSYHQKALPPEIMDPSVISRQASETILNEAMYHESDLVIIISGLNVHPISLWLLGQVGIPVAVVLTESPYDDEHQKQWADLSHVGGKVKITIFTNDRYSAEQYGWTYLAPAYDSAVHHPVEVITDEVCDVLMIGTGWTERQAFLEAVNWTGIDLRIYGVWPNINSESPLFDFYRPLIVDNNRIASSYCSSKICLNFHRKSDVALSPNPRTMELAACEAFQLSDAREDLTTLFGDSIPTFAGPAELESLIRYYLGKPELRELLAKKARINVQNQTFDQRAVDLMAALTKPAMAVQGD